MIEFGSPPSYFVVLAVASRQAEKKRPAGQTGRGVFASGDLHAGQNHELVASVLCAAVVVA